jgi:site-specific recombinase XerD
LLLNERGRNIRELQELLGHRSLATTARYTHIDRERLRGVVADLDLPAAGGTVGVSRTGAKTG